MQELLNEVLYDVLILLATVAAGFVVAWLRKRLGVEGMRKIETELAAKQELAALAVRFVEQAYKSLDGADKYDMAARWLADQAKSVGLKVSSDEIKGLIEAALRAFKDEFGDAWKTNATSAS